MFDAATSCAQISQYHHVMTKSQMYIRYHQARTSVEGVKS